MNNNDSVIKSFGTILIDNRHVNLQASKYKQNQKTTKKLVKLFLKINLTF